MKKFRLTRKVQVILAIILAIVAGVIIVGIFSNNKAMAITSCPNCGGTRTFRYQSSGNGSTHIRTVVCNSCGSSTEAETLLCTGGSWTQSANESNGHARYCVYCGYATAAGTCYDDNNDGKCDACGRSGMHTHSYSSTSYSQNSNSIHNIIKSCSCGATQNAGTEEHSFESYSNNGNGQHSRTCSKCGYTQTESHTEVIDEAKEATCTETGKTEGKHCSVCNTVTVAQQEIPAKGHTEVIDEAKEATCTETGETEGKHCSVCNTVTVAQQEIPAKGHNYVDGECTECGKQQYDDIEIESEKYEIDDIYISKIQPKTTVKDVKDGIQTNATEIKIYDTEDNLLKDTDIVGTKAKIELKIGNKTKIYKAIVIGDVDGDGMAGILDIISINKYRLNKKTLEEIYLKAADVTEDNKINLIDIIKVNKYRLNKITKL